MRNILSIITGAVATAALVSTASAQKMTTTGPGMGGSPHVKGEWAVDGANITLSYGRPYLKGRPEAQMMPVTRTWRTGADTATIIRTDQPLTFGTITLAPGSYTINTHPGLKEWQLILGRLLEPGQWGIPYQPELEIGRATMTLGKTAVPVEQVTISIDDTPAGGTLRVEWGTRSAIIPFTVGSK